MVWTKGTHKSTDWNGGTSYSTNFTAGTSNSTNFTAGTSKSTNWGSEGQNDFSNGYLLLQIGDYILLQNGYKLALQ